MKMAGVRDRVAAYFPVQNMEAVVKLFKEQLIKPKDPDITLLSIVLGAIENVFTINRTVLTDTVCSKRLEPEPIFPFPTIKFSTVEALYNKFVSIVKSSVDLTEYKSKFATRDLIKKVSDVIWSCLTRSHYKDKAHLQSLYSFLTGNKLDCFGVAFAVVAALQILGFSDVHLVLSEDHAWVTFGESGKDTAEVTWHGKGNEDKRGQAISKGISDKNWLYLNGKPVICNRHMEVAAMVSAINPSINSAIDSSEMASLQQEPSTSDPAVALHRPESAFLCEIYGDCGTPIFHNPPLDLADNIRRKGLANTVGVSKAAGVAGRYPMALGNLGDLEAISQSPGRPPPLALFQESIDAGKKYYDNQHVYPYTYMGAYLYRNAQYKAALRCWSKASAVMKGYNYNREDEEIYKEFLEIDTDFIPQIVKSVDRYKKGSILRDPECYADLLKFYDGICEWEEGSSTPVLHVGWATHLVFSLTKFDPRVRQSIDLFVDDKDEELELESNDMDMMTPDEMKENADKNNKNIERNEEFSASETLNKKNHKKKRCLKSPKIDNKIFNNNNNNNEEITDQNKNLCDFSKSFDSKCFDLKSFDSVKFNGKTSEDQIQCAIEELVSNTDEDAGQDNIPNSSITALAQACGESILNPDYLLGSGEPFALATAATGSYTSTGNSTTTITDTKVDYDEFLSTKSNGTQFIDMTVDSLLKAESPADMMMMCRKSTATAAAAAAADGTANSYGLPSVSLVLRSKKMKGLRKILQSAKLNASAIKLQLTAQSQVEFRHNKRSHESAVSDQCSSRKRLRRD